MMVKNKQNPARNSLNPRHDEVEARLKTKVHTRNTATRARANCRRREPKIHSRMDWPSRIWLRATPTNISNCMNVEIFRSGSPVETTGDNGKRKTTAYKNTLTRKKAKIRARPENAKVVGRPGIVAAISSASSAPA